MKIHYKVTVLLVTLFTRLVIGFPQKFGGHGWDKGDNNNNQQQRHNNGNFGYQQTFYVSPFDQTLTTTAIFLPTITPATFTTTQSANFGAGQIDVRIQQPQG